MKALGKASKVNKNDLNLFTKTILAYLTFKDNQYFTSEVVNLHFNYKFVSKDQLLNNESIIHEPKPNLILTSSTKIFGYDLPNNMNVITWGKIINHDKNLLTIEFNKDVVIFNYYIECFNDYNHVIIKDVFDDDNILLEFTDHAEKGSLINFY